VPTFWRPCLFLKLEINSENPRPLRNRSGFLMKLTATRIEGADRDGHFEAVRGILHGAMALYLARYLNVPPARIPGDGGDERSNDLPTDAGALRVALLDAFDRQRQVDLAARLVARHLTLGYPPEVLIATLARALLREDAGFHAYQMLEAGVRQFSEWGNTNEGRHILIAVARYLARLHQLRGGDAKVLKSLGRSSKGRHYRG
jgi:hypothetical protein